MSEESKIMEDILDVFEECNSFLISSHVNPDGDAIGSQLAIYSILSKFGKRASIINSNPVPLLYEFLPDAGLISVYNSESQLKGFEVAIILDCGTLERIGDELAA